ncbi:MAG TPA: sigma-54 dependent transcriptional regulator [Panacibacter sp.]|nr:sigma-54 dependent transcriptional regulator [Panacibacter sp.]
MKNKILIIDDDLDMCLLLSRFLNKQGYETDTAHSGNKGIAKFKEGNFDIVLSDYRLGDMEGRDVLLQIKKENPATIVLIITGYSDIKTAVEIIKMGAYDYITKPLIPDEVLNVLATALSQPANKYAPAEEQTKNKPIEKSFAAGTTTINGDFLMGQSPSTKALHQQIAIVAPTNYSIILYGESGTGKEVMARTIHEMSDRKTRPFIAMDCGTLSKELATSELFGHVKGAFTGALTDKTGHFELANGGTLFLDEVANLSYDVQASLLRVIQERKIKKVGGTKEMDIDVRIIIASNENLQQAYQKGSFREDLYHRFNEFSIDLPPLRNRKDDIPLFADFFLQKTNAELNKTIEGIDDDVMEAFTRYAWPGNLREFRNVMRRAVLLTQKGNITASVLPAEITSPSSFSQNDSAALGEPGKESALKDAASKAEYETIMKVLKEVNNNKSKAADILSIDRKTLYNKIKIYEESIR